MTVTKTPIEGLLILEPKVFKDERGYFFESYNKNTFLSLEINTDFVQDNQSYSHYGTIRGLHFQKGEYAQAKLVRVLEGTVLDVAVDLRKNSSTFGKHFCVELSGENNLLFFIPQGFAHGFSVLSSSALFSYKCSNYYSPASERGINPLDTTLNIDFKIPTQKQIIAKKDLELPFFNALSEEDL